MKRWLFLPVILLSALLFAKPRNPLPKTPDQVWQNDLDLNQSINSVISTIRGLIVNVKDFGAKGDGTTNDSGAIQDALDTGKSIFFPPGTYFLSTGITASTQGQFIIGSGQDLSTLVTSSEIDMLTVSARFIHVQYLTFDGGGKASTGIMVTTPKPYIENCTISFTSGTAINLFSFTNFIRYCNIFTNYGHGIKLSVGGNNNDTHITNNVISNNGKNGIWATSGSPSFTSGIFIEGNSMENNCSSGTATTTYAHIYMEGGTNGIFIDKNYHESDINQTGFAKQLFAFFGAGSTSIGMRDTYMSAGGGTQFDYYVEVGTSSYPVEITNCSLRNATIAAIHDFSGASGRVFRNWMMDTANQPSPLVNWPGLKIASNSVTTSDFPGVVISTYTIDLYTSGSAPSTARFGTITSSVTVQMQGRDASVTYPFYSFINSPQMGMYYVGSNRLGLATGGIVGHQITEFQENLEVHQPCFAAGGTGQSNVTGDGTTYIIPFGTERFDQSNLLSGSTVTANVGGRYFFTTTVMLQELDASHTGTAILSLVTSNQTYILDYYGAAYVGGASSGFLKLKGSAFVDMDALDTAVVTIRVAGGTKTVDIFNDATWNLFSGDLAH